jgi:hypothetical protein
VLSQWQGGGGKLTSTPCLHLFQERHRGPGDLYATVDRSATGQPDSGFQLLKVFSNAAA